jgi:60 kDa SS-A/Ro ribonucleoprotein
MLALDVSGSMDSPMMGSSLSCREAAAAMAMVTLAREPNALCYGFTKGPYPSKWNWLGSGLTPLMISPRQRLDDVVNYMRSLEMGGTDCALPFVVAKDQGMQFDAFVTYTDNETWAGNIHPVQALRQYRHASQIEAKSVTVGMTSTGFSIADPNDGGMMDVVGFDASAPAVISDFIGGTPQE